jgi:hypothetical protein
MFGSGCSVTDGAVLIFVSGSFVMLGGFVGATAGDGCEGSGMIPHAMVF